MTQTDPALIVSEFLTALTVRDPDRASTYLHEAIVWHNVSMPKLRGRKKVSWTLSTLKQPNYNFEVLIHNIASTVDADGSTKVLTERTDILIWKRFRLEFWVCGTFELLDGKIAVWRDYFDWANMMVGVAKGIATCWKPSRASWRDH